MSNVTEPSTLGVTAESSQAYWGERGEAYRKELAGDYHRDRLNAIDSLIPDSLYQPGMNIVDFGCGDAIHFEKFIKAGAQISGIDNDPDMIREARNRLEKLGAPPDSLEVGSSSSLARFESDSVDALLSFNVLAYLTDDEEAEFYSHAKRILKSGGYLIVTHSNELFDMYSLNSYTVEFFKTNFTPSDISPLLKSAQAVPGQPMYNVRENPLSYRFKLDTHGFLEEKQAFNNCHTAPPALLNKEERSYPSTVETPIDEQWKLMFMCSTFGSRSRKK